MHLNKEWKFEIKNNINDCNINIYDCFYGILMKIKLCFGLPRAIIFLIGCSIQEAGDPASLSDPRVESEMRKWGSGLPRSL